MNTALLRQEKINIYRHIITQTEFGDYEDNLVFVKSVRAGVLNQSQNKIFLNDELQFPQTRKFIVRSYVDVKENDVIEWNGHKWTVDSVITNKYYNDKEIETTVINE